MNRKKNAARERDDTRSSWHPAFLEAIKQELSQYGDLLEYTPEYQLTKEPLRIDTRELPEEENIWLAKLDNRLDQTGARKIISELNRLDQADHMGAYIDVLYNANFTVMEEVSSMFDLDAVLKTPWEKAGYVTRKMLVAAENARIETRAEVEAKAEAKVAKIVKNILAQGIAPETVAAITEMEIEKVREIAGSGNKMDVTIQKARGRPESANER